ncbi:MAG: hypothetical protein LBQ87_06655 [Candidatus Fibromonas sp.]|jgi:hypothetical protein|nr:hypothetical protein [Candidatus Fibromonas sp.]
MFTLKKLGLLSIAALAAFSMSCTDEADPGGEFSLPFTATVGSDGYVVLGGVITANTGNTITAVKATADGKTVSIIPPPAVGVPAVILTGTELGGICAATGATTSKPFKIVITVEFAEDGDLVSDEKTVTVNCAGSTPSQPLAKQNITLSGAGTSYADLDLTPIATYRQSEITAIKGNIDIVAYNGQTGESGNANAVYSPMELDIFYDGGAYVGPQVVFYPLPPTAVTLIKDATTTSDIAGFTDALDTFVEDTDVETEISVAQNTGFLVRTSERKFVAVIITSTGAQTVTLGTTKFPAE